MEGQKCAVTGACGFLGSRLVTALLESGVDEVCGTDIMPELRRAPAKSTESNFTYVAADIRNTKALQAAFKGMSTVFHTASYYGSPPFASLNCGDTNTVVDINYNGTLSVIKACIECGVKRLIYISSSAVLFSGERPLDNVPETTPLPNVREYIDPYSLSKASAEVAVVAANGGGGLATSVIRPNGIWGASDACVTLMRILSVYRLMGGIYVDIGAPGTLSDWVHVDNLTYGCGLLASKLTGPQSVPAGQVYHMNDEYPISTPNFAAQMLGRAGFNYKPWFRVPDGLIYGTAVVMERLCYSLRSIFPRARPLLTRIEAKKAFTTHYFSCDKAKRELGYVPSPAAPLIEKQAAFFANNHKLPPVIAPHLITRLNLTIFMAVLFSLAYFDPSTFPLPWEVARDVLTTVSFGLAKFPTLYAVQETAVGLFRPLIFANCAMALLALMKALVNGANVPQWTALALMYGPFGFSNQIPHDPRLKAIGVRLYTFLMYIVIVELQVLIGQRAIMWLTAGGIYAAFGVMLVF